MNKSTFIKAVAKKAGKTQKDTDLIVNATIDTLREQLIAGECVQLFGFGTFESIERSARTGRNPRTGEVIPIAPTRGVKFKPSPVLREEIQNSVVA